MALFKLIHLLAVIVWLGGMFFAYMVLRKSAAQALPVSGRLKLWEHVFMRFFNWVWGANFLLLVSGLFMIYQSGGFVNAAHYVQLMLLLGILMFAVFCYLFFFPSVHFSLAVSAHDWLQAETRLIPIRRAIGLNLILGIFTLALVAIGRAYEW
jgi:uncharacterized membrane protein